MSSKGHKSDYAILAGLGLLVGVCLLGIVAWSSLNASANVPGVRTTHSTNVDGTMVASLLFERFNASVSALESPLLAESLSDVDVLWVIDPLIPLNGAEVAAIEDWVSRGGVLVTTGIPGRLVRDLKGDADRLYGGRTSCRVQANRPSSTAGLGDEIPDSAKALPLARGIAELQWVTNDKLDLEEQDEDEADTASAFKPLLRDRTGVRIAGRRFNEGAVILLAESSFLANGMIGKQDNAVLAVNLARYSLSRAAGTRVAYDEYHLGYGHHESGLAALSQLLLTTSPGWAVLSLTVAGLLYLLLQGRQFGTRREPGRPRRRSKMEFVQAIGASFQSAGTHGLAWRLIFGAWKREAGRSLGLAVSVPVGDLGARLARRAGKPADAYTACLTACEQATQESRLSARKMAELVGRLAQLEREAMHEHPGSKSNR